MKDILITSSVLIAAVTAVRFAFRNKISRRLQYALWGLVLLRLLLPVPLPQASFSVLSGARMLSAQWQPPVSREADTPAAPESGSAAAGSVQPSAAAPALPPAGPAPAAPDSASPDVLTVIWLTVAGLVLLWFLGANLSLSRRLKRTRVPCPQPGFRLPVYVTGAIVSPCLFGLFRPAVYLTPKAAASPDSLRHVLTHELCHFRHGDHIWSLLRGLCLSLYWFDPLVWAAAILSRADSELACDEAAIRALGAEHRLGYGKTLVDMIAVRRSPLRRPVRSHHHDLRKAQHQGAAQQDCQKPRNRLVCGGGRCADHGSLRGLHLHRRQKPCRQRQHRRGKPSDAGGARGSGF